MSACPKVKALIEATRDMLPVVEQARASALGIANCYDAAEDVRKAAKAEAERLLELKRRVIDSVNDAMPDCFYIVVPGPWAKGVLEKLAQCALSAAGAPVTDAPEKTEGAAP